MSVYNIRVVYVRMCTPTTKTAAAAVYVSVRVSASARPCDTAALSSLRRRRRRRPLLRARACIQGARSAFPRTLPSRPARTHVVYGGGVHVRAPPATPYK